MQLRPLALKRNVIWRRCFKMRNKLLLLVVLVLFLSHDLLQTARFSLKRAMGLCSTGTPPSPRMYFSSHRHLELIPIMSEQLSGPAHHPAGIRQDA